MSGKNQPLMIFPCSAVRPCRCPGWPKGTTSTRRPGQARTSCPVWPWPVRPKAGPGSPGWYVTIWRPCCGSRRPPLPGIPVERLVLAANTAMTDIFLDRDISGLCAAPYRRSHAGGCGLTVEGLPPLLIPPLPAPFVGGDISAGLLRLLADGLPRPLLLADLGTNGELALVDARGRLWLASVPLGPALEGIGPQCGRMAGPGSITRFEVSPWDWPATVWTALWRPGPMCRASAPRAIFPCWPCCCAWAVWMRTAFPHARLAAGPACGPAAPTGPDGAAPAPAVRAMAGRRRRGGTAQGQGRLLAGSGGPAAGRGLAAADVACLALAGALGEHCPPACLEELGFCPPAWDGVCVPWATARWMAPPCWPPSPGACPHWHAGAPRPRSSLLLKIPASMPITCAICALEYKCPIPDRKKNTVKLRPPRSAPAARATERRSFHEESRNDRERGRRSEAPRRQYSSLPVSRPSAPHGVRKSSPAGAAPASGRPARP